MRAPDAIDGAVRPPGGGRLSALTRVGSSPDDDPDLVVRKQTLTIAAASVTILSTIWVVIYAALGLPQAAVIPLTYQLVSIASLVLFARTRRYDVFAASQLALMLVLPFALQWVLGGFENSSVVGLWALVGGIGAVYLLDLRRAVPWFLAFLGLVVLSGLLDPALARDAPPVAAEIRTAFFVLNVAGVSIVTYLLLQYFVRQREAARAATEALLLNILPAPIADRLKGGAEVIVDAHPAVTVLFADVVDFTPFAEEAGPREVVDLLDSLFSAFDELAVRHGLEKIKTIGDAYMVAGGLPFPRPDHAEAVADMALDMLALVAGRRAGSRPIRLRIGIDSGPVIAGVIGRSKIIYDLWGDTVNTASRMELYGEPDVIQVTPRAAELLSPAFVLEPRETIQVKGKGWMTPMRLAGRRS